MTDDVKYWVACSGGVDSVVLAHIFSEMNTSFGILHCNFQLRGKDSDDDEVFVKDLAEQLKVPFRCKKFDTSSYKAENNVNTQIAARELRYSWFDDIVSATGTKICLAHHKDDQIETFLLQLRRGGKIKGLSGMSTLNKNFVRPLLTYTKSELLNLALENDWKWREDFSNRTNHYKRNLYRNELLPLLSSDVLAHINQLVLSFQELRRYVENSRFGFINIYGALEVEVKDWKMYPSWVKQFLISNQNLGKFPVHEIDKLCDSESGASFKDGFFSVWKWKDSLVFYQKGSHKMKLKIDLRDRETVDLKEDRLVVDASKVIGSLRLRKVDKGDMITPLGKSSNKSISRFLKDKTVPVYLREEILILTDDSNKVLAVPNLEIDNYVKVGDKTGKVYIISTFVQ